MSPFFMYVLRTSLYVRTCLHTTEMCNGRTLHTMHRIKMISHILLMFRICDSSLLIVIQFYSMHGLLTYNESSMKDHGIKSSWNQLKRKSNIGDPNFPPLPFLPTPPDPR